MIEKCMFCGELKQLVNLEKMCKECEQDLIKELELQKIEKLKEAYYDKL